MIYKKIINVIFVIVLYIFKKDNFNMYTFNIMKCPSKHIIITVDDFFLSNLLFNFIVVKISFVLV